MVSYRFNYVSDMQPCKMEWHSRGRATNNFSFVVNDLLGISGHNQGHLGTRGSYA
jgi:hypothetical protein